MPEEQLQTVEQMFAELEKRLQYLYQILPGHETFEDIRDERRVLAGMVGIYDRRSGLERQLRHSWVEVGIFDQLQQIWDNRTRHPHLRHYSEKKMRCRLQELSHDVEKEISVAEMDATKRKKAKDSKRLGLADEDDRAGLTFEPPPTTRSGTPPPYTEY